MLNHWASFLLGIKQMRVVGIKLPAMIITLRKASLILNDHSHAWYCEIYLNFTMPTPSAWAACSWMVVSSSGVGRCS